VRIDNGRNYTEGEKKVKGFCMGSAKERSSASTKQKSRRIAA